MLTVGALGDASWDLDVAATGVEAGDTLHFQFWFRDGGGVFNTSNALQLTFCE